LKFYKSFWNFNSNRTTYKEFFGCLRTSLFSIWWFVFLSFWPPLLLGAITFSILLFLVCQIRNRRGLSFFWTLKTMEPSLGSSLPWALKCLVINQFTLILIWTMQMWNVSFGICNRTQTMLTTKYSWNFWSLEKNYFPYNIHELQTHTYYFLTMDYFFNFVSFKRMANLVDFS